MRSVWLYDPAAGLAVESDDPLTKSGRRLTVIAVSIAPGGVLGATIGRHPVVPESEIVTLPNPIKATPELAQVLSARWSGLALVGANGGPR